MHILAKMYLPLKMLPRVTINMFIFEKVILFSEIAVRMLWLLWRDDQCNAYIATIDFMFR